MDLRERFTGDPTKARRFEPAPAGLIDRIETIIRRTLDDHVGPDRLASPELRDRGGRIRSGPGEPSTSSGT